MDKEKIKHIFKNKTLLVVDDDSTILEAWQMLFSRYFGVILTASNGIEGLELYKNNEIDLILSDITMPKMNGIDMAKEIFSINSNSKIIFLTGHNESDYIEQTIQFGGNYLLKPTDKKDVIAVMLKLLE